LGAAKTLLIESNLTIQHAIKKSPLNVFSLIIIYKTISNLHCGSNTKWPIVERPIIWTIYIPCSYHRHSAFKELTFDFNFKRSSYMYAIFVPGNQSNLKWAVRKQLCEPRASEVKLIFSESYCYKLLKKSSLKLWENGNSCGLHHNYSTLCQISKCKWLLRPKFRYMHTLRTN